jgi:hypothetical protein
LEHREWVQSLGLCVSVDFSMLDQFDAKHVKDLRDMREHEVEYFKGTGRKKNRWRVNRADASSRGETIIGGRLDWMLFSQACQRLLPLLSEPIPYPVELGGT